MRAGATIAALVATIHVVACSSEQDDAPAPGDGTGVQSAPCNDPSCGKHECEHDADCATDYCTADFRCSAPPADVHTDGRRNGGETGVDCGGSVKSDKLCPGGQGCKTNDDCISTCTANVCDTPTAKDGKKNQGETDIDCGGMNAPGCAVGKACGANEDCELLACTANACVVPTDTDGVVNGSETDVDCGGPGVTAGTVSYTAPRCTFEKKCTTAKDCLAGACSPGGKCEPPSCATMETAGIVTCGSGETGAAGAVHESCCKSLVLPTRTTRRLDKYEITAGRMRTFLTAVGPNVRQWVSDYAAANPTSQLATLVTTYPVVKTIYPAVDRFDNLSLTAHMSHDIDNYDGIRGCYNGDGSYGANTYWMDATHYDDFGLPARSLPRTTSDEKPLNCAMPLMFMAFCAWDGGELPLAADITDVWPNQYPIDAADVCGNSKPCDNYNWCNGPYLNGGFKCENTTDYTAIDEPGVFYEFPLNTDRSKDNEPLIGAPGRFTKDATLLKSNGESWFDILGSMVEYDGEIKAGASTFCDMSAEPAQGATTCTRTDPGPPATTIGPGTLYSNIPTVGIYGRSWEGHVYDKNNLTSGYPVTFQYGKFGARCVRPANKY